MGSHFWNLQWIVLFLIGVSLNAATISPEPIAVFYTLNSILNQISKKPLFIGDRARWATCTDVRWSPDGSYLASIGLLDRTLWFYHFDGSTVQPISHYELPKSQISAPEKLTFSPDGDSLALVGLNSIAFFSISDASHAPCLSLCFREKLGIVHDGVFSPDGNYFACVTITSSRSIYLFKKEGKKLIKVQSIFESLADASPKGIIFSADNRFLVVGFSQNASSKIGKLESYVVVYFFDRNQKKIQTPPISMLRYAGALESIAFSIDEKSIYCVDQALDRVLSISFDVQTGTLGEFETALQNPKACLNFPHGIGVSPDGKYLAVSNYGDDKITIYEIKE